MYHFLFVCDATNSVRRSFLPKYLEKSSESFGKELISRVLNSKDLSVQMVSDIGKLASLWVVSLKSAALHGDLEELSMVLCIISPAFQKTEVAEKGAARADRS